MLWGEDSTLNNIPTIIDRWNEQVLKNKTSLNNCNQKQKTNRNKSERLFLLVSSGHINCA